MMMMSSVLQETTEQTETQNFVAVAIPIVALPIHELE